MTPIRTPLLRAVTALAAVVVLATTGCTADPAAHSATAPTPGDTASLDAAAAGIVAELTAEGFAGHQLTSLIVQVRIDGRVVATETRGESLAGVPVARDARFRNGAVAMMYLATTMLALSDAGRLDIDEPIARWLPDLADADTVTPRMLASMTSGYPDYLANPDFIEAVQADAFRQWQDDELFAYSAESTRLFEPGQNWDYSHAGFLVLARVLEAAGGAPLQDLVESTVLGPLALRQTQADVTAQIPEPVQHGFTAERGVFEDSTYWNPSWTLPDGAVQTTSIDDMAAGFDAVVGRGELLGPASYDALISTERAGFGAPLAGCRACLTLTPDWNYGLGVFLRGDWVLQTPLFGGYQATVATLPESRSSIGAVTVAVSAVPGPDTYADWTGKLDNWSSEIASKIGTRIVSDHPLPNGEPGS